jgi:hypothetical protein
MSAVSLFEEEIDIDNNSNIYSNSNNNNSNLSREEKRKILRKETAKKYADACIDYVNKARKDSPFMINCSWKVPSQLNSDNTDKLIFEILSILEDEGYSASFHKGNSLNDYKSYITLAWD